LFAEEITNEFSTGERTSSLKGSAKKLANFSFDSLEPSDFETVVNSDNILKMDIQIKIKYYFRKTLDLFIQGYYEEGLLKLNGLVSIMLSDVFKQLYRSKKGSQVRFLGEYEICHPLNVAVVAGLIAKKLDYTNLAIENVILAGLLHDCGKLRIKLSGSSALLTVHEDEVAQHTTLGYELIKNDLHLSDDIANAALEHHENNDGSGYPSGLSSDYISELAQIINVANYYDNLACNRTPTLVSSNKDALRAMLEVGTKRFSARMLYTFVHMFNYDDPREFNDMIV
jgi:HD-GYP domain-containing protein (c-di-GMP phosphodiesterase class II)